MKENNLHLVFVLGLIVYGLTLIAMMGKQNNEIITKAKTTAIYKGN